MPADLWVAMNDERTNERFEAKQQEFVADAVCAERKAAEVDIRFLTLRSIEGSDATLIRGAILGSL